jgi:hypothetical protein
MEPMEHRNGSVKTRVKIDISFVGISGETTVFEHMSVVILGQDGMYNKNNDLRHV